MNPFKIPSQDVIQEHLILGNDVFNIECLKERMVGDSRMEEYIRVLQRHKKKCPYCSCPHLYAFFRAVARLWRIATTRKVRWGRHI